MDLNPHQIEAALFALRSPISKGVLLTDEVGLGKTVEAGLVLCQYWAERRRRLLVIVPASLQKQWSAELGERDGACLPREEAHRPAALPMPSSGQDAASWAQSRA